MFQESMVHRAHFNGNSVMIFLNWPDLFRTPLNCSLSYFSMDTPQNISSPDAQSIYIVPPGSSAPPPSSL